MIALPPPNPKKYFETTQSKFAFFYMVNCKRYEKYGGKIICLIIFV